MFSIFNKVNINEEIQEFNSENDALLLDVRTKEEYDQGHIPNSTNIEVSKINRIISLTEDKDKPLYVYCRSGSRSTSAVKILKKMGFKKVKNIGGIISYNGPLER